MTAPGLVVVGSGPGGMEAVRAFREADADTPVTMVTADPDPPYNRPPLTKDYLRGETELAELWLAEEEWFAEHGVELRLGTEVDRLDADDRRVGLADGVDAGLSGPGAGHRVAAPAAGRARRRASGADLRARPGQR